MARGAASGVFPDSFSYSAIGPREFTLASNVNMFDEVLSLPMDLSNTPGERFFMSSDALRFSMLLSRVPNFLSPG